MREDLPPALATRGTTRAGSRSGRDRSSARARGAPSTIRKMFTGPFVAARTTRADDARRAASRPRRRERRRAIRLSLRKRRTFRIRTGITSTNRKTAIAEPSPKSPAVKAVRHIASAITFASDWVDSGASAMTRSKTLRTLMTIVMKTTVSTGASSGTVTRRKTCQLAGAVGARGLEHVARHRREARGDHDHREARPDPEVRDQQRRRDQASGRARRSRSTAWRTSASRSRPGRSRRRRSRSRRCRPRRSSPTGRCAPSRRGAARSRRAGRARPSRPCRERRRPA